MRVKIFQAPTAAEAMRLVRRSLGDDAVILSTKEDGIDGFAITSASRGRAETDPGRH